MEAPRDGSGTRAILFTDLVDSAGLRARVGEEAADRGAIEAERRARDLVRARRGWVVKGTGDGVLAAFESAADALAAAVSLQQRAAHPTRIGISIGDVTWRQGDCFGQPVVEAARLVAAAGPHEILIADLVRLMARGRGGYRFESVGELDLKGLAEPLAASRVLWDALPSDGDARVPLPSPLRSERGLRFVGRTGELGALRKAWMSAQNRDRQVVFISGEPGAGKTRLASQLAREAHQAGALVLFGGSDEQLALPYQALAETLGHLVDDTHIDRVRHWAGEGASDLARLLPRLGTGPAAGDPEIERQRLFSAVSDLLRALTAERPTVWLLDDLQWAGRPTMLLLHHLLRTGPELRLLVIATHRDTELDRGHPLTELLADLRRLDGVNRVALRGLGLAEVTELAGTEPLARSLLDRTGGNPFFVAELLQHVDEGGRVDQVPGSVTDIVRRRLARLAAEVERVVTAAAVIGLSFELRVLRQVVGGPVELQLEAAERARLIEATAGRTLGYRFTHALARAALYDALPVATRARLHRDVAAALEALHPDPSAVVTELAHHWSEAAPLGHELAAVGWCRRAAQHAIRSLGFAEAATHLRRALDVGGAVIDERTRAELRVELAEALGDDGQPLSSLEAAAEVGDVAAAQGWSDLLIRSALSFGGYDAIWALNRDRRGRRLAREALARSTPGTASHAQLLAKLASLSVFSLSPKDRLIMATEVLGTVERLHDPVLVARIVSELLIALDPDLRSPTHERAIALLAKTTDPRDARAVFRLNRFRLNSALLTADGDAFRAAVADSLAMIDQLPDVIRSQLAAEWGNISIWDGDLAGAERLYEEAWRLGRRELPDTAMGNRVFALVLLSWLRGDLSPARAPTAQLHAELGGPNTQAVHVWVELACGLSDPAVRYFDAFGERERRVFLTSVICSQGLAATALAARALSDPDAMQKIDRILAEIDVDMYAAGPPPVLAVAYYRGVLAHGLGDLERAGALLEHSLAVHQRLTSIPYVAASQAALALVRAAQNQRDTARSLATTAIATAERIQAWGIERQCRTVLEHRA